MHCSVSLAFCGCAWFKPQILNICLLIVIKNKINFTITKRNWLKFSLLLLEITSFYKAGQSHSDYSLRQCSHLIVSSHFVYSCI